MEEGRRSGEKEERTKRGRGRGKKEERRAEVNEAKKRWEKRKRSDNTSVEQPFFYKQPQLCISSQAFLLSLAAVSLLRRVRLLSHCSRNTATEFFPFILPLPLGLLSHPAPHFPPPLSPLSFLNSFSSPYNLHNPLFPRASSLFSLSSRCLASPHPSYFLYRCKEFAP